jgi:chromosome segregation ATPase
MTALILAIALVQALVVGAIVFLRARAANAGRERVYANVLEEVEQKRALWDQVQKLSSELADPKELAERIRNFAVARESLKAERGRVTIAQAELDMIEVRLRELEEIHRELEASTTETKEELRILQRKEDELKAKNDNLRVQIAETNSKMEVLLSEIEVSAQMQEQVVNLKAELLRSEEQVQTLLNEIQKGNEQYLILKRRYDALDVEYAQLYQQFNESHR